MSSSGESPPTRLASTRKQIRPPRTILLDEAHQFIPEPAGLGFGTPGRDSSYSLGVEIMQLRKYGISLILVSQRTAVVAKSALSQCENIIAFKSVDQTGLDYLEQIAGPGMRTILSTLRQGEALVMGPAMSSESPVAIRVLEEHISLETGHETDASARSNAISSQ